MVTVDSNGRIVLPSEVREQLGLRPGSEVEVNAESGRAVIEPEATPEHVMETLETMIDQAATNREHRQESESEGSGRTLDDDPIAATQRKVIRRGAITSEAEDVDASE